MRKVLLALVGPALLAAAAAAAQDDFKEVHKIVPLQADGRVSIDTFKGWIDVEAWDRAEVDITARIEPDETGENQAEKVRETEIRIDGSGSRVHIESHYGRARRHGFLGVFGDDGTLPYVRYTIRMPRAARLEVKDYKSVSHLRGLTGNLEIDTYKGRMEITGARGPVDLETYKGEIRVEFDRFAESRFQTYKGDIEISLPQSAAFQLDADVGHRGRLTTDIAIATQAFGSEDGKRMRGAANGGGPELQLETYKGSFRVRAR